MSESQFCEGWRPESLWGLQTAELQVPQENLFQRKRHSDKPRHQMASTGLCVHAHVCISHMYTRPHLTSVYTCMCVYHTHVYQALSGLCVLQNICLHYTHVSLSKTPSD